MEKEWFPLAKKSFFHLQGESFSSRNFLKKNWIPPNFNNAFHKQKESCRIRAQPEQRYFLKTGFPLISTGRKKVIFKKIGFFLISIIVSTSGIKSCKILFCLCEIVLFSTTFLSGNHYWNYFFFIEKLHSF